MTCRHPIRGGRRAGDACRTPVRQQPKSANGDIGLPLAATTDGRAACVAAAPGIARTAAVRKRSPAQAGYMRLLAEEETLKRSTADLPYRDWHVVYV